MNKLRWPAAASDFKRKLTVKIGGKNCLEKLAGKTLFQLVSILSKHHNMVSKFQLPLGTALPSSLLQNKKKLLSLVRRHFINKLDLCIFNRPGEAGAVLQTPLLLIC